VFRQAQGVPPLYGAEANNARRGTKAQQQVPKPQAEAQPGINLQAILNAILGGGDGKF